MKSTYASAIVLALSAVAASQAFAGDNSPRYDETIALNPPAASAPGKTREDVRTELADARRTGDIVFNLGGDNSGAKLNQLYATQYPAKSVTTAKTREEVRAELADAQRTGDIVANLGGGDKSGTKLNQLYSTEYPANRG